MRFVRPNPPDGATRCAPVQTNRQRQRQPTEITQASSALITRRSRVQILAPLTTPGPKGPGVFFSNTQGWQGAPRPRRWPREMRFQQVRTADADASPRKMRFVHVAYGRQVRCSGSRAARVGRLWRKWPPSRGPSVRLREHGNPPVCHFEDFEAGVSSSGLHPGSPTTEPSYERCLNGRIMRRALVSPPSSAFIQPKW